MTKGSGTPLVFGSSALGSMPITYGYAVEPEQARQTIRAILDGPAPALDTSRNYGDGRSEQLVGEVLAERGGVPAGCVISTKLDRDMDTNAFDGARARQSIEQSLDALGVDRVDILHLHDPKYAADLDKVTRPGGAIDELFRLRDEGVADRVGLAMGKIDLLADLYERYPFDIILSHNRYTLLNRQAEELFSHAAAQGTEVWNAAPYAGGVLAKGAAVMPRLTYQPAGDEALEPVRAIEAVCAEHDVPLGAVALQFSMRDPLVSSTVIGVSKPERVAQTIEWSTIEIPDEVWSALREIGYDTDDPEANREYNPG